MPIHFRPITPETYRAECFSPEIFGQTWQFEYSPRQVKPDGQPMTWGLYDGETLVGWSHAYPWDENIMYMADTGILPAYQGQGLYSRLLPVMLSAFRAAGYREVVSIHKALNNAVIIPKLRAGFVVQKLGYTDSGLEVTLSLALDETYSKAQQAMTGWRQPNAPTVAALDWGEVQAKAARLAKAPRIAAPSSEGLDLGGGYSLQATDPATFQAVYAQLEASAYATVAFDWQGVPALPMPEVPRHCWLVVFGGEVVGWQASRQYDKYTALMQNTALLPAHRGKGVYKALLAAVLDALRSAGYQKVISHHHAVNNAVLVPKLRAGFAITGLSLDEHGLVLTLTYSFDPVYAEYLRFRSGMIRPEGELLGRMGLAERE